MSDTYHDRPPMTEVLGFLLIAVLFIGAAIFI